MGGADEVVGAFKRHAKRSVAHNTRPMMYAEVKKANPLVAELHEDDLVLDSDDLVLGSSAKKWEADVGIDAGDTLVVRQMQNGDWLVVEVVSENALPLGPMALTFGGPLEAPVLMVRPAPVADQILLYGLVSGGTIMLEAMLPNGTTRTVV